MIEKYIITELTKQHDRRGFDCGYLELNHFLVTQARGQKARDINKTFVAESKHNREKVFGFYTILPCETEGASIPGNFPRRVSGYLISRLAIDKKYQGQGLGSELLVNAIHKSVLVANYIGGIGVFVDAKGFNAREFYLHMGFEQLPNQSLKLFKPMSRCRKLFT